jgi:predicted GH43/DUF377 family glycosyl hydrolase
MVDSDEPPPDKRRGSFDDLEGILLVPNESAGEKAVLNPSICQSSLEGPWPFAYRSIMDDEFGGHSVVKYRLLLNPTELGREERTIIQPSEEYDCVSCEDPGLNRIGDTWYIPYVGWDGLNARICLATTKNFRDIKKFGVIGPQIPLEEAIEIVPNEIYKKTWTKDLKEAKAKKKNQNLKKINLKDREVYLWDKDVSIEYESEDKKWILIHRLDPHIHIAIVDNLEDLKDVEFWRDYLRNIDNYRIDCYSKEPWEARKVGVGGFAWLGDKKVGIYHGVNRNLWYSGGICEVDPKSYIIQSRLRSPLLRPNKKSHIFEETDVKGRVKRKRIIFSRGSIVDKKTRSLYIYSGIADEVIGFRSTNIDWVYQELNHPHNRIKQSVSLS